MKTTAYDLPTRFFHWIFAFLFLAAFIIAQTIDDDNPLFAYHMMAGIAMVFILVLRFVWGFIGTTYARFSSFKLNPWELLKYFKDSVIAKTKRYMSHNPAFSYAAVIMFIAAIGLGFTGVMMAGGSEIHLYEEIHEILANIFLITVILHLVGIIFHQLKHKDSLWLSMLDGKKEAVPGEQGIANTKPVAGITFIILTFAWIGYMSTQYNTDTQTLNLFGNELQLGEEEHSSNSVFEAKDEDDNDD